MSFFDLMYCYRRTLDGRDVYLTSDSLLWILNCEVSVSLCDFPTPF